MGLKAESGVLDEEAQIFERFHRKLEIIRNKGLDCQGSEAHRFKLAPPIEESEVERFELFHGISLPSDYRDFLTLFAAGGAGPEYGIFPLSKHADFIAGHIARLDHDGTGWVLPSDFLSRPCPFLPGWNEVSDESVDSLETVPFCGTIKIGGNDSLLSDILLIVSGVCRGRVATVDWQSFSTHVVDEPNFLTWYEAWLDSVIKGTSP